MADNTVVIKKDMLFDDDMWRQLNKELEPKELKVVFSNQQEADAFDEAIKKYYAEGEKATMKLKHFRSTRGEAMKWWNNLHVCEKFRLTVKYNNDILSNGDGEHTRSFKSLTGREIEMLYKAESKKD